MALLELDAVESGYETGQVLFDVSMTVERGEVVSLLGRNGAGKTTTLRSIMGVDPPTVSAGDIRFQGESMLDKPSHRRAQTGISFVPEERRLWPNLTVEENIRMAINHAEEPKDIDTVLSYFPILNEMLNKRARHMSGGEQQMLAIARGFASNPALMMLDEPSEGLAPYIVRDVESAIEEINDEGVTILFVEQNALMAMDVSDRHYIIDQGQIVAKTTPTELRSDEELHQEYLSV